MTVKVDQGGKSWGYLIGIESDQKPPLEMIKALLKVLAEIGRVSRVDVEELGQLDMYPEELKPKESE